MEMTDLSGRVAVVTGASSGIGCAIASTLAKAGVKTCMGARRCDRLEAVKADIEKEGGTAIFLETDVSKRDQVKALVAKAEAELGPVDILINVAGVMSYTLMKNLHEDEWEKQIDVNCKGVLNGIGAVLDNMLKRKSGHILSISSDAGRKVFPGLSVYSGTKFFVEAVHQGLRLETADSGIRVTTIQPGDVATELTTKNNTDSEALKDFGDNSAVEILKPADIARAVVYALSQPPNVSVNEILIEPRQAPC